MDDKSILGIIGGSGLYQMECLENVDEVEVSTPFGSPSSPVILGEIKGKKVAFITRHGKGHTISPTNVNYRANIYSLKKTQ